MGTQGLNFNAPACAGLVTKHGRDIISKAANWVTDKGFQLCNIDTDGILFSVNNTPIDNDMRGLLQKELNSLFPKRIKFTDDGYFPSVIIIKTKNYSIFDGKEYQNKGSGLRSPAKEKALAEFMQETLRVLHE
jgi:DNA polymerase elongation subunit (family B)